MKLIVFLMVFSIASYAQEDKESFWERMARYHDVVASMVQGSLDSRGMSLETLFRPSKSWESIRESINEDMQLDKCGSFDCPDYEADFAQAVHSRVAMADKFSVLPNKLSFDKRRELIKNAKYSIHILVWGMYDDETGLEFQNLLLNKLTENPKIDIRIAVDGNIANLKGRKTLKKLEKLSKGAIKVMKWKSRKYRANGTHRKILIIDSEHVIIGGMNIGNEYSHLAGKEKWRDLDIYIQGEQSGEIAEQEFVEVWNNQIVEFTKLYEKLGMMAKIETEGQFVGLPVVFVDQHPGSAVKEPNHNIHTGIVKLLRNAQETIDIENAYFIMDPIIKRELEASIKRGVKVRVYTNSDKSVDEALISMPVMNSARDAATMGAKVYLRQTTTLHSKYMVLDKKISVVGSFNLHPRSLRFDAENVAVVFEPTLALELTKHFEEGLLEATYIDDPKTIHADWSLIGLLVNSFYFDFL
jgi:cardiolipin synthase